MAIVLAEEDEHGLIEGVHISERRLLSGLALVVHYLERQIPVLPASLEKPVRQVDVFAIHEEVFVEQAHLIECLTAQQAIGSADDLNLRRLVPGQMTHVVTFGESQHFEHRDPRCRNGTTRFWGNGPLAIQHAHACPTRFRMGIHEVEASLDGGLIDYRIGIQQQHVFCLRESDGLIVGTGKSHVLLIGNKMHLRMSRT